MYRQGYLGDDVTGEISDTDLAAFNDNLFPSTGSILNSINPFSPTVSPLNILADSSLPSIGDVQISDAYYDPTQPFIETSSGIEQVPSSDLVSPAENAYNEAGDLISQNSGFLGGYGEIVIFGGLALVVLYFLSKDDK